MSKGSPPVLPKVSMAKNSPSSILVPSPPFTMGTLLPPWMLYCPMECPLRLRTGLTCRHSPLAKSKVQCWGHSRSKHDSELKVWCPSSQRRLDLEEAIQTVSGRQPQLCGLVSLLQAYEGFLQQACCPLELGCHTCLRGVFQGRRSGCAHKLDM